MCKYFYKELNEQHEFVETNAQCNQTEVLIPNKGYGNDSSVRMLVHTPKDLADKQDNACIINAHGGGAIAGSPDLEAPLCNYLAVKNRVVVFNVAFRLAGSGAKVHQAAGDIVTAIKYIRDNAPKYGVDSSKICLYGCSGGGYV